jgi:2-polyprenyl-6-methoxyphenol hydroxylase-like FAD-dependent oxidoreductase
MTTTSNHRDGLNTQVLIVGAGPVGLSLAMDLASRGIQVVIAEIRRYAEPPNVKCNHVAARTMEQFRRLGVAQKLRDAGLPRDYPNDVVFRTTMTGTEITRIPIPCREDRYTDTQGPDGWWPTPEPPHRINQIYLEPILLEHAANLPGVTLLNRTQILRFEQSNAGVTATALRLDTGESLTISAMYMVGCDGGRSKVRKHMGAKLEGTDIIQRVQSTYIRAPQLAALIPGKPAWSCYAMNPRRCGTVFAIDGRENWLIHNHLHAHEPAFDSVDRDQSIRDILGVGSDFSYEVISKEDWVGRRLVANRFRNRRVFLAGDSAHLWMPYAGYGMNAGIADALNLSWVLAAHLQGWASENILNAYEAERQPITEQVSQFAMNHAQQMIKMKRAVPEHIEAPGPDGDALRAEVGRSAYDLNVQQFCCAGLNFGYFYANSPIIAYDDEAAPAYSMGAFTASTVPGCRAPHFWLKNGASLYDQFGSGFTLLKFNADAPVAGLCEAIRSRNIPLTLLDLSAESAPPEYRHALVLCRSDQHVVWRSDPCESLATAESETSAAMQRLIACLIGDATPRFSEPARAP